MWCPSLSIATANALHMDWWFNAATKVVIMNGSIKNAYKTTLKANNGIAKIVQILFQKQEKVDSFLVTYSYMSYVKYFLLLALIIRYMSFFNTQLLVRSCSSVG